MSTNTDRDRLAATAPDHIWLDLGEIGEVPETLTFQDLSCVTWSEDNATGCGIRYVREGQANTAGGAFFPQASEFAQPQASTPATEVVAWMTPGEASCITRPQRAELLREDAKGGPDAGFGKFLIDKHTVALVVASEELTNPAAPPAAPAPLSDHYRVLFNAAKLGQEQEFARCQQLSILLRRSLQQLAQWQTKYGEFQPEWLPPSGDVELAEDIDAALSTAPAEPAQPAAPLDLAVIRKWPEGFEARLQAVWLDVVSFIPTVKLYDLQRVLAEFGFTMEIREGAASAEQAPHTKEGEDGDRPRGPRIEHLCRAICAYIDVNPDQVLDYAEGKPCKLAWHRHDLQAARLLRELDSLAQAVPSTPAPDAQWSDPRVKLVYDILASDEMPPVEQHWEGWVARRIVDALAPAADVPAMPEYPSLYERTGNIADINSMVVPLDELRTQWAARLAAPTEPSDAVRDVLVERRRQVDVEGWTPEHDDEHDKGDLAYAAASYAIESGHLADGMKWDVTRIPPFCWPWEKAVWKIAEPRRMLVKSAALIIAEIERLDRAARKGDTP